MSQETKQQQKSQSFSSLWYQLFGTLGKNCPLKLGKGNPRQGGVVTGRHTFCKCLKISITQFLIT